MEIQDTKTASTEPDATTLKAELDSFLQGKLNELLHDWDKVRTWDINAWQQFWEDCNPVERCRIGKILFPVGSMQEELSIREKMITEVNTTEFARTLICMVDGDAYASFSALKNGHSQSRQNGKYINAAFWRIMRENINHFIEVYKKRLQEESSDRQSIKTWIEVLETCKKVIA